MNVSGVTMSFIWRCVYLFLVSMLEMSDSSRVTEDVHNSSYAFQEVDIVYQPVTKQPDTPSLDINDTALKGTSVIKLFQNMEYLNCIPATSTNVNTVLDNNINNLVNDINTSLATSGVLCDFNTSDIAPDPSLTSMLPGIPTHYSQLFSAVAATLSAIIFVFGILGNMLVVVVIARTRSMHTTTNCYLLSLAVADSLVLLAATLPSIPEPFFRVDEWPYGRVMCSLLIFLQYLGVDSSSLSITAFTIERYIAICHPMKAHTLCTVSRAKRIIAFLWVFTFLYCSPWLGLTEIRVIPLANNVTVEKCQFRFARSSYLVLYMIDLILFYIIPLIIATVLYILIGRILSLSTSLRKADQPSQRRSPKKVKRRADSRVQVVRMLVVVVVTFASLWMPYRVMVVYNSFAQHKYMDLWFLLFARTMVYVNCAINPVLYNIMSVKFKRAFRSYLNCWQSRRGSGSHYHYSDAQTDNCNSKRSVQPSHKLLKHCGSDRSNVGGATCQTQLTPHQQQWGDNSNSFSPSSSATRQLTAVHSNMAEQAV